jgi:hypothetical protein
VPLEESTCKLALTFCRDIVPVLLDHKYECIYSPFESHDMLVHQHSITFQKT